MTEQEELAYVRGSRMFALRTLVTCLTELGYDSSEGAATRWVVEREETVSMLRRICEEYGDNDWEENLHLADVIDKHLWQHLEDDFVDADDSTPPLSFDDWPAKPEETPLCDVGVPPPDDTCRKLSRLLRAARDFTEVVFGDSPLRNHVADLMSAVCALDDLVIEGDTEEIDDIDHDTQSVVPASRVLGPQDDQIVALARENAKLRRDYDRLKHLYDTRMEVTQEAVRRARETKCLGFTSVVNADSQIREQVVEKTTPTSRHESGIDEHS